MPEEKKVNKGAPIDFAPGADLGGAVDAEIARIVAEKQPDSSGFDGTNAAHDEGSTDAN
jgi:hypothetical protein